MWEICPQEFGARMFAAIVSSALAGGTGISEGLMMNKLFSNGVLGLLLLVTLNFLILADSTSAGVDKAEARSDTKSDDRFFEEPPLSVTAHSITVGGKTLKYHATASVLRDNLVAKGD